MTDRPAIEPQDPETTPEALTKRFGRDLVNDFDLDDPAFNKNFDETLNFMVRKCPVVHSQVGKGYYLITTQDDVRAAASPVLRHRMFTNFTADSEGMDTDKIVKKLLDAVPEPDERDY